MKNFFDTKDEKITEKAFSQSLLISVLSILLCIVALCSITYAWFTGSTSSGNNTLVSGSFDVEIDIVKLNDDGTEVTGDADAVVLENGIYTLTPGEYKVTLTPTDDATVKGYCVITLVEGDKTKVERTKVITNSKTATVDYDENTPFIFYIITTSADAMVEIEAHWGVPADPIIEAGVKLKVSDEQTNTGGNEAAE